MNKVITENQRTTPVAEEVDVLVCGGGPAGIGAALAAARGGAKTCLLESQGCLGGVWTAGLLAWLIDYGNKDGIMREIVDQLDALGARACPEGKPSNGFDVEIMKALLEDLCMDAGVILRLNHYLVDAVVADGKITHAICESKSGREAISAKAFIDCTGDGDLAARAGCGFELGKADTGETQPMSMLALVAGIDPDAVRAFHYGLPGDARGNLKAEMERAGLSPSYAMPTLSYVRDDLFFLMANHEYGASAIDGKSLSDATVRGRREVHQLVNALRNLGDPWSRLHIVATGAHIGVREGRRIHGRYQVTAEDLVQGARHPDAVCRATFEVDVHATDKKHGSGVEPTTIRTQPYDIPLRALIAKDLDGLMMAGRCISGDFLAHSSYRVTGNAVAMGEGAGRAAAEAIRRKRYPHELCDPETGESI